MTVDTESVLERHTMVYSDCDVDVVLTEDGEYEVDFRKEGEIVVSFSGENWTALARFVKRAVEMSE